MNNKKLVFERRTVPVATPRESDPHQVQFVRVNVVRVVGNVSAQADVRRVSQLLGNGMYPRAAWLYGTAFLVHLHSEKPSNVDLSKLTIVCLGNSIFPFREEFDANEHSPAVPKFVHALFALGCITGSQRDFMLKSHSTLYQIACKNEAEQSNRDYLLEVGHRLGYDKAMNILRERQQEQQRFLDEQKRVENEAEAKKRASLARRSKPNMRQEQDGKKLGYEYWVSGYNGVYVVAQFRSGSHANVVRVNGDGPQSLIVHTSMLLDNNDAAEAA